MPLQTTPANTLIVQTNLKQLQFGEPVYVGVVPSDPLLFADVNGDKRADLIVHPLGGREAQRVLVGLHNP